MKKNNNVEEFVDKLSNNSLAKQLETLYKCKIPTYMAGQPGIGKSAIVQQMIKDDWFYRDVRAAQLDPVDVNGLPIIARPLETLNAQMDILKTWLDLAKNTVAKDPKDFTYGKPEDIEKSMIEVLNASHHAIHSVGSQQENVVWARPNFIPEPGFNGEGVIFFDELPNAPHAVQNTLLQPFGTAPGQTRYLGAHMIPSGIWLVCAGNRAEDNAAVNPLVGPMINRIHRINVEPNLREWTAWAMNNNIDSRVVGFCNFNNGYFCEMPPEDGSPYATPRSWVDQVHTMLQHNVAGIKSFKGGVGESAATAFMTYLNEIEELPNIDKLIAGKEDYDFQNGRASIIYTIMVELNYRCKDNHKLVAKCIDIAIKASAEKVAVFVSSIINSGDPAFIAAALRVDKLRAWCAKHKSLIKTAPKQV